MKNKRKQQFGKLDRLLELPKEVCSDVPKIIITGFEEMIIENFKGIFSKFFILLKPIFACFSIT